MIKLLVIYMLAILLYVLLRQKEFLLPILLAVSMMMVARMVARAFTQFTASILFKQIVYLFFISGGIQYLLAFMDIPDAKEFTAFKLLNFIPLIIAIAMFYRYILYDRTPYLQPIKELPLPQIKTVKKKVLYYEILNEIATYPMVGC